MKDAAFRTLPLDRAEVGRMLEEIRGRSLFDDVRGAEAIDREALVSLLLDVAKIAAAHPEIAEIDLNPVVVNKDGYAVVDARIILDGAPSA